MKAISRLLAGALGLAVLVAAFMAYFVRSVDPISGAVYDGLGRALSEPPWWAQFFLSNEHSWAGLGWHIFDIIWFFGGFYIAFALYSWGEKSEGE